MKVICLKIFRWSSGEQSTALATATKSSPTGLFVAFFVGSFNSWLFTNSLLERLVWLNVKLAICGVLSRGL